MRKQLRNSPLRIRPTQHDFARPSPSPSFSMRRIVHVRLARAYPEARSPLNPGILKLTDGSLSILSRPSCFVPYPSTKLAWSELAIQTPETRRWSHCQWFGYKRYRVTRAECSTTRRQGSELSWSSCLVRSRTHELGSVAHLESRRYLDDIHAVPLYS